MGDKRAMFPVSVTIEGVIEIIDVAVKIEKVKDGNGKEREYFKVESRVDSEFAKGPVSAKFVIIKGGK
jgi:hypothetical protein